MSMAKLKAQNHKLITVLGPTASGKSGLAVRLAKKINGEVISADSRQVYREMDIGTGKITKREMQGIPHHLLDVASPKKRFSVAQYQKLAFHAIEKIRKKGKIPILCGGTGFYIQAVVDGISIPEVKPDWKLRKKLEKKSNEELFKILKKLDSNRAKNIDKNNPRRLIRAIEIVKKTKKPIPAIKSYPQFDVLLIGIKKSQKELEKLIAKRLQKRLKAGMMAEIKKLKKQGISWKRLEEFGLEYRWIAKYLRLSLQWRLSLKKLKYQEMTKKLQKDIEHFAKRQMTWFKKMGKNHKIHWIRNQKDAERLIKNFLKNRNRSPRKTLVKSRR